jgi:hypothetical protein
MHFSTEIHVGCHGYRWKDICDIKDKDGRTPGDVIQESLDLWHAHWNKILDDWLHSHVPLLRDFLDKLDMGMTGEDMTWIRPVLERSSIALGSCLELKLYFPVRRIQAGHGPSQLSTCHFLLGSDGCKPLRQREIWRARFRIQIALLFSGNSKE